jgi:hypothetical protein
MRRGANPPKGYQRFWRWPPFVSTVSTATSAIFFGPGFVDIQRPPIHVAAVESGNGVLSCASPSLPISTNPNPRARPVSRSVTMFTRSTRPELLEHVRTAPSVASKLRFPTKIFFTYLLS